MDERQRESVGRPMKNLPGGRGEREPNDAKELQKWTFWRTGTDLNRGRPKIGPKHRSPADRSDNSGTTRLPLIPSFILPERSGQSSPDERVTPQGRGPGQRVAAQAREARQRPGHAPIAL